MIESKFPGDSVGEKVLGGFLDRFFYNKIEIDNFYRHHNKNEQYLGMDVTIERNGTKYIIDEKAALHYPDGLNTFALELHYKKGGKQKEGWLFDDKKVSTHYLFAWPIRKHVELNDLKQEDIKNVEVMLVNRKSLIDSLNKSHLSKANINSHVNSILIMNRVNQINQQLKVNGIHQMRYSLSKHLGEAPVNLVVNKEIYKSLAEFHFKIYRDKPYPRDKWNNSDRWLK
jgi:hypothetical protein